MLIVLAGLIACDNPKPRPIKSNDQAATSAELPEAAPVTTSKPTEVGAKVKEKSFSVWLQTSARHTVGGTGTIQAVLVPGDGYKCNATYPYKFKAGSASEGVKLGADVVTEAKISKPMTVIDIPIATAAPGKHDVSGSFHFSVCTEEICEIEKRDLTMTVTVH